MLIPADPKSNPMLLHASRLSLKCHPDHVVLGRFKGVMKMERRRTCDLPDSDLEEIVSQLGQATISRVSISKGSAIPPFFALEEDCDKLRLVLYIARGTVNEDLRYTSWSSDLETLGVILGLCGRNQVAVPEHVLGRTVGSDAIHWVDCSLSDLEASSKELMSKQQ